MWNYKMYTGEDRLDLPASTLASTDKTNASNRCTVCKVKGKHEKSRKHCSQCDMPLCAAPCFELYHIKVNF
uniref:PiggyBac transposable element-derived protein 4 C-terminal zinc-finger domain-containing protein n=1 Tax=Octopus bimaculoides TaxID=37653 RepID=A0A0L8GN35_OCTBM